MKALGRLSSNATAVLASLCISVHAAAVYPVKPVRMIVPFPAGGPTDALARFVAQKLTETWGQQVVVDNRGGANGIIGQDLAARSAPDGHTLLVQSVAFAINPSLYKLPYDSDRDFVPVVLVASTPLVLAIHPALSAATVKELVGVGKAKPRMLTYASFGNGSIAHLAGEMFKSATGVDMVHVPYKGVPQAIADLAGGRVQVMFPGISSALPHAEAGRLRLLAVTSAKRSALAPQTPTMMEAGVPGLEIGSWFGVFVPSGTPGDVIRRLNDSIERALQSSDAARQFQSQGFEIGGASAQQFAAFIRTEAAKFARVVKTAGVKVD